MKILYICTFYHTALLYWQQAHSLLERGNEVKVFNSAKYNDEITDKYKEIVKEPIVKHVECWNALDRLFFFPRQWKIERKLQEAYKIDTFDLIHSHLMLSSGYTALRMKKKYGTPYVVSVRATDLYGFIKLPYFRKMANRIIKSASGVLFLSNSHKKELIEKYLDKDNIKDLESKAVTIGNCLESFWSEHIASPRNTLIDDNEIRVLSVARITSIKNLETAAKAIEYLNTKGYKATLTIVGENLDNNIYNKLLTYNIVNIKPFMSKEELIEEYKSNDIFLLPSINETFGRVYIEAMSQGLPVLYTKGQGFDNTFNEGEVGYSVPTNDYVYIADRILDIINNYHEISNNCINNSELYKEDNIVEKIELFYNKAIEQNR